MEDADDDPEIWITNLESLKSEMNKVMIVGKSNVTDIDMIIHVLSNLPEEYEVTVSELEERLKSTSDPLEIKEVRTKLNSRYQRLQKHGEKPEDIDEKALVAFYKQFKGRCTNCGEIGHKSENCPEKDNKNGDSSGS